jgi:autotransporter-associated beta strand protein
MFSSFLSLRSRFAWLAYVLVSLAAPSALGQTYTWNNFAGTAFGGANTYWGTANNWVAAPVFDQNAVLVFPSSPLQIASNYTSIVNAEHTVNSLVFALEGNPQGLNNGLPKNVILGDTELGFVRFSSSTTGTAPSIIQNGAGSVNIRVRLNVSALVIESTSPLRIGGNGTGLLQIAAPILAGGNSGPNSGLLIDFDPAAVRVNNTGATVQLSGNNTFTGDVVLVNGNLAIGSNTALGVATNRLVVNAGSNSVRMVGSPIIPNPIVLNSTMTVTSFDGSGTAQAFTGAWSGTGGLTFRPGIGSTYGIQGAAGFTGPLILQPLAIGQAGTANNLTVNIGSSATTNGTLATTNIQLFAGSVLNLNNTTASATRLAAGTNLVMHRSGFALIANAATNASETIASLTSTGMPTIVASPTAGASATLTFGSWTRNSNSTAYFLGTSLGSAPAANVGTIVFTTNPGGATPGSTTAGSQNLAVLPYAYANTNSAVNATTLLPNGNLATSLVRWDSASGRIVALNTTTEYANTMTLANSLGAAGLNYRLAGAGTGGVASTAGNVSANGLVIDTNMAAPAPPVGLALVGSSTLNLTGPILSTYSGSSFPTGISTFLPDQIAVGGLDFGANTAYFHTPGDLWVRSPISGSGGLVKSGDTGSGQANLYLLATNTFTGGLTINAGGVYFTSDANLGAADGGILMNSAGNGGLFFTQMPHYNSTPAASPTISRPLTLGTASGTLGSVIQSNTLTYSGLISGTNGLTISTVGPVALTNASNSFTGDVMIRGGTLIAANDGALGAASNRILMGVPLSLPIFQPGSSFTTSRDFLILNGGTIFTNGFDLTISGVIASTQTNGGGPGLVKGGLGTLTLTGANTLGGVITIGDTAGTATRVTSPQGTQYGGTLRLSGASGSMPLASGFAVNNAAALVLDNSTAVNNDRIGVVGVGLSGGSFTLIGNDAASVTELMGAISANDLGTVTMTQPTSTAGQVTTLRATALSTGVGNLFVRGTNFGATTGDRTQLLVTPANITTSLPTVNGIVIGGFAAASDTATGPTDFLAVAANTNPVPNAPSYRLAPLATYGALTAPGATINANQAGATFALTANTDLNALRIGAGGGLDLATFALTMGTATVNQRAGTILAAGGDNAGIIGGTINFSAQAARIVTTNNLTIGTLASPTALLGTNTVQSLLKSGPGTLTLFGTNATTLGANAALTGSGTVTVAEGTLMLGNATALGRATLNSTTVAPIPNVLPFTTILRGGTLDLSALSAAPVRFNTISGGGNIVLGDTTVHSGLSSSSIGGNITGSATSRFINGIPQSEIPFNTFGGGGPALTGDNSGFLGQWVILRGTMNFASNLSFGTGTSAIQFSDTASNGSTGSVTLRIDAGLTVPFPRNVEVPAGGFALPTFLVGNSSNITMTGSLALGKAAGVSGTAGSTGIFTFAGPISGVGQLQLGTSVFGSSGSVAFAVANPNWSGGILMNTGQSNSAISSIVAVGADNSLGTGTLTLGQFAGLLRADGGTRTLANPIDVFNSAPTAAFTTSFGSTGVNNITLTGNVRSSQTPPFNLVPPAVPATPFTHTLNLNTINQGTTTFAGTISNGSAFNFGITKNGFGTVAVNGNNSYTGDTVINAGTIRLGNPNALGLGGRQGATNVPGAVTVNSGSILDLNGQLGVNKPITLAGGSLVNNSATAASISGGTVSSLTMTATGGAASAVPVVTLTGGGGTGATAIATLGLSQASLVFVPLTNGGSGYTAPPTVTITDGGGSGATATATLGVTVQTFTITNGGSGYLTAPTVTISGSGTSGATTATATATITGGVVTAITITNPGTGYYFAPTITFGAAPVGGTTATGIGNAANFQVGSVVLTNPGGGFSSAPTVTFTGGGGTGATVTTNATNFAMGLQVTNPGSGYTSAPTVTFDTGTATATANLSSITLAAGTTSAIGGSGNLTVNAAITGTGSLIKIGAGTVTYGGVNTYTGTTTLTAGVLQVGAGGTLGTGAVVNNASLVFNRSNALTVTNVISGTGSVTQNGPGALYLNAVNTYTGATTVAASTLGGSGSIAGPVTVANGATIRGGNAAGVGTLTIGNGVTLASGANFAIQITNASTPSGTAGGSSGGTPTLPANNNFILVSAGGITADPTTLNYRVDGGGLLFQYQNAYSFRVAQSVGQDLSGVIITDPARFTFTNFLLELPRDVSLTGDVNGVLYLNFTPVPEPGTMVAFGAAVLGVGGFIRRRLKRPV